MVTKKGLVLLGVWDQPVAANWPWIHDHAVAQLVKLTGKKIIVFCYLQNGLNYECFTQQSVELLKNDFAKLHTTAQLKYVKKISDDYYRLAVPLSKILKKSETIKFDSLTNREIARWVEDLFNAWSVLTMHIWYVVLIDIWYSDPKDMVGIKKFMARARDHCGHLHARFAKVEEKMYGETAKRLKLTRDEAFSMTPPELAIALRGKRMLRARLRSRLKLCVESNISGKLKLYEGKAAKKIMQQFIVPTIGAQKLRALKGTPASAGKARGLARVIRLDREFSDFKEGEILVALQTMVHYVPLMKKARAILTEFGGLTSHAAIVSRELGKPSIVGISGLITSVKTGDLLDIDASKGIVTIEKTV